MHRAPGIRRSSVSSFIECFLANSNKCPSVIDCGDFTKAGNCAAPRSSETISNRTCDDDLRAASALHADVISTCSPVTTDTRTNPNSVKAQVWSPVADLVIPAYQVAALL